MRKPRAPRHSMITRSSQECNSSHHPSSFDTKQLFSEIISSSTPPDILFQLPRRGQPVAIKSFSLKPRMAIIMMIERLSARRWAAWMMCAILVLTMQSQIACAKGVVRPMILPPKTSRSPAGSRCSSRHACAPSKPNKPLFSTSTHMHPFTTLQHAQTRTPALATNRACLASHGGAAVASSSNRHGRRATTAATSPRRATSLRPSPLLRHHGQPLPTLVWRPTRLRLTACRQLHPHHRPLLQLQRCRHPSLSSLCAHLPSCRQMLLWRRRQRPHLHLHQQPSRLQPGHPPRLPPPQPSSHLHPVLRPQPRRRLLPHQQWSRRHPHHQLRRVQHRSLPSQQHPWRNRPSHQLPPPPPPPRPQRPPRPPQ